MRRDPFRTRLTAVLALFALILAACGPSDEETPSVDPADQAPSTDAPEPEPDSPYADGIDPTASLTWAHAAIQAPSLDPHTNAGAGQLPLFQIFDRLIHQVPGTSELVPGLATSWHYPEEGVLEMELREGVVFHDGTPFNAEAVQANLERAKSPGDVTNLSGFVQGAAEVIAETEIVDEFTVRLHAADLSDGSIALQWAIIEALLAQSVGMMISPAIFDDEDAIALNPAGAGPYKVVSYNPGDRLVLERFEDYWDPSVAAAAEFTMVAQPDAETRLNSIRSGEADIAIIEPRQIPTAEGAGLEVLVQPTAAVWNWWINRARVPALEDNLVMQALQHSIDRDGLVEALTFGTGVTTLQIYPPGHPAYSDDHGPEFYAHDPERSLELLEEAGYGDGVTIELAVQNRTADNQVAELLQSMAADGGFNIEINVIDPGQFSIFIVGDADSIIAPRSRLDALELMELSAAAGGVSNPSGFSTDRMEELLAEAARTPAGPDRDAILREASGESVEQNLIFGLFSEADVWAMRPDCIVNFDAPVNIFPEWRGTGKSSPTC